MNWFTTALEALNLSDRRIVWNLFLAFIPLILSILLFQKERSRSLFWWLGLIIFLAFLPNAPYVLTDTIHLIEFVDRGYSISIITLAIIPQYFIFIFAGVEAYVISLMYLNNYLQEQIQKKYIVAIELTIHFLCAIGIYLGRFDRFNSWDFVSQPMALIKSTIHPLLGGWQIAAIAICFLVLIPLSWIVKQVNLSLLREVR
jgi:uncharacterized membrane protein